MTYQSVLLERGKNKVEFNGNFFLGSTPYNIKPLRLFCKELGADAVSTPLLNSKSNFDFDEEVIIATFDKVSKTLLSNLESNENVKVLCYQGIGKTETEIKESIKLILENSKKPIIVSVSVAEIGFVPTKEINLLINFVEEGVEKEIDDKIVIEQKKKFSKVFVRCKFETPEGIYQLLRNESIDGVFISDLVVSRPTIFEQSKNYFEKGYYNKLTRKRREKVVDRFSTLYSEYANPSDKQELDSYIQRFLEE